MRIKKDFIGIFLLIWAFCTLPIMWTESGICKMDSHYIPEKQNNIICTMFVVRARFFDSII